MTSTPATASSSLKEPGSMTRTRPSFSRRTQACRFLVSFMVPILLRAGAGRPRGHPTHRRLTAARLTASPGSRLTGSQLLGIGARLLGYDGPGGVERGPGGGQSAVDAGVQQGLLYLGRGQAVAQR